MKSQNSRNLPRNKRPVKQTENSRYLKIIAKKLNSDKRYRQRMLGNYSFAKKELSKAGLEINPKFYQQIRTGYKLLNDAATKVTPSATLFIKIQRSLSKESF